MAIKTEINAILNKQMDRTGFLKHLAIGAAALAGFGWVVRLSSQKRPTSANAGYSSAAYGGQENHR